MAGLIFFLLQGGGPGLALLLLAILPKQEKEPRIRKALINDQGFSYNWWSPEHLRKALQNLDKSFTLKQEVRENLAQESVP